MQINLDHIIPSAELSIDTLGIKNKLLDSSELIVFENNQPQFVLMSLDRYNQLLHLDSSKGEPITMVTPEIKIGKLVQESVRKLFYENKLLKEELEKMTTSEYSAEVFNLNIPALKMVNKSQSLDEQKRDQRGYNRYYNFTLKAYGQEYLLCSQWVEYLHREKFEKWLQSK